MDRDYLLQLIVSSDNVSVVIGLVARPGNKEISEGLSGRNEPCKRVLDDNNLIGFMHILSFELEVIKAPANDIQNLGKLLHALNGVVTHRAATSLLQYIIKLRPFIFLRISSIL